MSVLANTFGDLDSLGVSSGIKPALMVSSETASCKAFKLSSPLTLAIINDSLARRVSDSARSV